MIKKELLLPKKLSWQDITYSQLSIKLLKIFKKHIGHENAISKEKIFKILYNVDYDCNLPSHFMLWEFVKRAMNKVRKESKCFISSKSKGMNTEYFVIKDQEDADFYINRLKNSIKKMQFMMRRAQESKDKKWYKENWKLPYTSRRCLK